MKHIALVAVLAVLALLIPLMARDAEYNPAPEEPPLPTAPLPQIEPVVPKQLEEPLPLPPKKELPPGTYCLDDCPLIDPAVVEKKVREYFADAPVLVAIAECESHFRHYKPDGTLLTNKQGSSATGVMQIMYSVHAAAAENLGLSIRDFYGNLAYARHLYDTEGTRPWEASRHCWGSDIVAINMVIPST